MAEFFVRRPIVAMVIAIITVIVGLVALQRLPIAQYPEITPPIVNVAATYTGASAVSAHARGANACFCALSGLAGRWFTVGVQQVSPAFAFGGHRRTP